ncbi:DUF3800 domain-containing protein [Nitratireductor mangrovi]|uniref:DUF3800 domain-containing protein n=1 Tax=Nitratireductor mangrovi TaxID=2599600 RepID=A0A5B8KV76_9HYPH|nr:DUF3800 domain-containing protein [Nitratireductor mangrovi]QDY99490.1 DUF3800 domain-containing protein [Nitratireductor mangrovi]
MTSEGSVPEPYFVAYFDEAGDPGIKTVAPIDPNGASEWFTLGCAVVRAANEPNLVDLVRDIKASIFSTQSPDLHYRNLKEHKKKAVCEAFAAEPMRFFVVVSHKPNMRRYRNPAAEKLSVHPNDYFYNYCIRVALERISDWCAARSINETGEPKHVKLVFSRRGGHSYRHIQTYIHLLANQVRDGRIYQTARVPDFRVIDHRLIEVIDHNKSAGCQIADVVASAFFQAANAGTKKWNTAHAESLKPRMASTSEGYANEGVTLLPWRNWTCRLTAAQKSIFRFYGYQM